MESGELSKTTFMRKWIIGDLSWRRVGRSIVLIYGILFLYAVFFSDSLIFQPHPSSYSQGETYRQLETSPGENLTVKYLVAPDARFTVLFSHGNAEDLGEISEILDAFPRHGYSVIGYDYSGFGTSSGAPSEEIVYANIESVYRYLREEQHIDANRILVFGRSVGAGPSVELATHYPVAGLILESAFTSAFRVITRIPLFPFDKFNNLRKISTLSCPLLIIHGQKDEVIPFWHGETLYAKAPTPKMRLWVESANHNDLIWRAGKAYWDTLAEFSSRVDSGWQETE